MVNEIELKPCPFCGEKYICATPIRTKRPWRIICSNCKARTWFYETIDDAVNAWNKRWLPKEVIAEWNEPLDE